MSDSRSVKADRERGATTDGKTSTGVPIQRLCVDAMRRLHEEGQWTFNQQGSRLWLSTQGLFLVWNTGADDIIKQVVKDNVGGFPRSENTLLAAMLDCELLEKAPNGSPTWFVAPSPLSKHGKPLYVRCVKLKSPFGVFPFLDGAVSPVSVIIGRDENAREYLIPEDAKARKEREKNGHQEDLFEHGHVPAVDTQTPSQPRDNTRPQPNRSSPHPPVTVEPGESEAADDDEPILKIKLTCNDLLNPRTVRSPRPQPAEPAKLGPLQTPRDHNWILANPELGIVLLELLASGTPIREVRNRAFIPLDGKFTVDHLPAIEQAGWLWHDITSPDSPTMLTLRGTTGFLASIPLSMTCCRLTGADWQPRCQETLPAERQDEIASLARAFRALAVPEPSHGPHVWSIPFWARDRVAEEVQVEPQVADEAICYGLEAVRVGRVRRYFFEIC